MNLTPPKRYFLLALPVLLIPSTALVFVSMSQWLGKELGYVLGFLFYFIVWCLAVPLIYLGRHGLLSLFKEETPLFRKENWLLIIFLLLTTFGAAVMYLPSIANAPILLVAIALPVAIISGTCEEILWRGLYTKVFPHRLILGFIYPTIGFAVWHVSPQLVFPSASGIVAFAGSTFFLGLCYGAVAYKTGSIKWTALSHSLNGILALGGALAPSIFRLVSS